MEVAIVNLLFTFDPTYTVIGIQTIWAIGISMVILGLVILLPFPLIAALGFLIVLGHNSLDFYEARHERQPISFFYDLMHRVNFYPMGSGRTLLILYPFLPWTGLMILGYCFGKMFTGNNPVQRNKLLLRTALIVITGFIALRALNIYGNPEPWEAQKNAGYTLLSFIDTHKYPPSLAYMLMTIGPGILFLALVRNTRTALAKFVIVYGRVPFFYYLAHFLLIHLVATAIFFARGHSFQEGITGQLPSFVVAGEGFNLFWTYIVWIAVVVALYPVCKWYDTYKTNHKEKWWLSYL